MAEEYRAQQRTAAIGKRHRATLPPTRINRTLWEMTGETKAARNHPGSQHHFAAGRCTLGSCTHTEEPKPEETDAAADALERLDAVGLEVHSIG